MSGAYQTPRFKPIDDHFREWLVERALEFRAIFNPFITWGNLETAWYRTLYANLRNWAPRHFYYYCREHGINENYDPSIAWTSESTDRLTDEIGDAWVGEKYKQNNDLLLRDPEKVLVLLETLREEPTVADFAQALKSPALCEWEDCQKLKAFRGYCPDHYQRHIELWGSERHTKCIVEGCIDYGHTRGMCRRHYLATRDAAVAQGTWQPRELKSETPCSIEGCTSMVGTTGRNGRCYTHHQELHAAIAPRCGEEGCDEPVHAVRRCKLHYQHHREANTPQCSIEGCEGRSRARSLCNKHYKQWQFENAPECSIDECTARASTRGLCNSHYQRQRKKERAQEAGEYQ